MAPAESPSSNERDREILELHNTGIVRTVYADTLADEVEKLCTRVGLTPERIPQLLDVMYRETAMRARYAEFVRLHQSMLDQHLPAIRKKAAEFKNADYVLVQTAIPIPLNYLMALEGFLGEARRLVTDVVLLVATAHHKDASREFVQLTDLVKKIRADEPVRHGDLSCQALIRQHAPEIAKQIVEGSDGWLGSLKEHRDDLEHRKTLARSFIEFYAADVGGEVRGGSKVYTVEGERLLAFAKDVVDGAGALAKAGLRHLTSAMSKGDMEPRVETQEFFDNLKRQIRSTTGIAPLIVAYVKPLTRDEWEAARAKGGPEPRVFTFD